MVNLVNLIAYFQLQDYTARALNVAKLHCYSLSYRYNSQNLQGHLMLHMGLNSINLKFRSQIILE